MYSIALGICLVDIFTLTSCYIPGLTSDQSFIRVFKIHITTTINSGTTASDTDGCQQLTEVSLKRMKT